MASDIKYFDLSFLDNLTQHALSNKRRRLHFNIHNTYQDPCQRLFNAIEPESYIHPHRHATDPKVELLVAIRGLLGLVTFDDYGNVNTVKRFGAGRNSSDIAAAIELSAHTWHTVIALEPASILLEVKAGPFDPNTPKDLALWAPEEGSEHVPSYMNQLKKFFYKTISS